MVIESIPSNIYTSLGMLTFRSVLLYIVGDVISLFSFLFSG
jgi:hypothetical protein